MVNPAIINPWGKWREGEIDDWDRFYGRSWQARLHTSVTNRMWRSDQNKECDLCL